MARDDAELAVKYGVYGIIVSNHGGHEDASARGTIESQPEVVAGVAGKISVLIDSGFGEVRRASNHAARTSGRRLRKLANRAPATL